MATMAMMCDANVSNVLTANVSTTLAASCSNASKMSASSKAAILKRAHAVWKSARALKKKAGRHGTPAMFGELSTSTLTEISKKYDFKTAVKNHEVTMVSGSEWPETKWNAPGAWYPATVLERTGAGPVLVVFKDDDKDDVDDTGDGDINDSGDGDHTGDHTGIENGDDNGSAANANEPMWFTDAELTAHAAKYTKFEAARFDCLGAAADLFALAEIASSMHE